MEVNDGVGLNYKPCPNGSTSSPNRCFCVDRLGVLVNAWASLAFNSISQLSKKYTLCSCKGKFQFRRQPLRRQKGGERGREWCGGGLMSHECRSIVSKTHPSSTSQSRKYDPAHLSGGFTCSNIYSHFQLLFLIHAEAILPYTLSLSGILSLIMAADINVSI